MKQYIDKAEVITEIVIKMNRCKKILLDLRTRQNKDYYQGKREAYIDILSFLDTLEVKEFDLEGELNDWRHEHFHGKRDQNAAGEYLKRVSQLDLAKHFFELGLKAKGE